MDKVSSILSLDMNIDDFADFVFIKNVNDAQLEISLGGVEHNKDLFCFFVDLMCKGLVLIYGNMNDDNKLSVDIESLTIDNFEFIKKKMALAKIKVILDVYPNELKLPSGVNIRELIEIMPNDAPLEDYIFIVTSQNIICSVQFAFL